MKNYIGYTSPKKYKNQLNYTPVVGDDGCQILGGLGNEETWVTENGIYFLDHDFFQTRKYLQMECSPILNTDPRYLELLNVVEEIDFDDE